MSRVRILACLILVLSAAALSATVAVPTEFREVVADATLILRGRVTDVRAVIVAGGAVESISTIAVESVVKGQSGEFAYVRVPGGQIGRYRTTMVGAPKLFVGESALFFLKRGADDVLRPVGLTMGVYQVQADPRTGRAMVHPPVVQGVNASAGQVVRGDVRRTPMAVPEFESLIKLVMSAPPPRGRR